MKAFASLLLALALTLALPAASALEFQDFQDKEEIQYPEAVAMLNRLGIITGFQDGYFRPDWMLSRGSAAKIIVSLRLGGDAAGAMSNDISPYPDVPSGSTFAGVIDHCKSAGLIDGYADGTFRPRGELSGFAFAKMLLGVLGYDSAREGFSGEGWTQNVTRAALTAGLLDGLTFQGDEPVSREAACQMAFNALKANMTAYDSYSGVQK